MPRDSGMMSKTTSRDSYLHSLIDMLHMKYIWSLLILLMETGMDTFSILVLKFISLGYFAVMCAAHVRVITVVKWRMLVGIGLISRVDAAFRWQRRSARESLRSRCR